jgi:phosphoglycolate phosphatase-like HAD superfamily hydrolase
MNGTQMTRKTLRRHLRSRGPREAHNKQILVLDFDGVICDSREECMLVAWHGGQGDPVEAFNHRAVSRLPSSFVERFEQMRPYARHLGHFLVPLLSDLPPITSQEAFEAAYEALDRERRETFQRQVQLYRQQVREQRTRAWSRSHRFYQGVIPWLRRRQVVSWIVTARDQASVLALLASHKVYLSPDRVYGEQSSKLEALAIIANAEQVRPEDVIFVDDHPGHVQAALDAGFRAYFATWGYGCMPPERMGAAPLPGIQLPELLAGRFPDPQNRSTWS